MRAEGNEALQRPAASADHLAGAETLARSEEGLRVQETASKEQLQTVRRDAAGTITAAIHGSIARGHELREWSEVLTDEPSFEVWRSARRRWASQTSRLLSLQFECEAVEEFVRAAGAARSGQTWQARLRVEARATTSAIELLCVLASTLGG
jgi:hypothetical protein